MYTERFYREWSARAGLSRFRVGIGQSDLLIQCDRELEAAAADLLRRARRDIEDHLARDPAFGAALSPVPVPAGAPPVVRAMAVAARRWGVGPMAAVAGAVAEAVGRGLLCHCDTVIVENGGDVFARSHEPIRFAVYAGSGSPFSDRIAFEVDASEGVGVCTSSGTVGPSVSFGSADAVVAIALEAAEADAAATAVANSIRKSADVDAAIAVEAERGALRALLACAGDRLGVFGDIALVKAA